MMILFMLFYFLIPFAQATVSPQTGEWTQSWVDMDNKTTGSYSLERTYRSQSSHDGLFGRGWCTDWDVSIQTSKPVKVLRCGVGLNETVRLKKNVFVRSLTNGDWQKFDRQGKLIEAQVNGKKIQMIYDRKRLIQVRSPFMNLVFSYNQDGRISSVKSSSNRVAEYKYSGSLLHEVRNAWGNIYRYGYTGDGMMSSVAYPDQSTEVIIYNGKRQLAQFQDRNRCKETFTYPRQSGRGLSSSKYCGKTWIHSHDYVHNERGGYHIQRKEAGKTFLNQYNRQGILAERSEKNNFTSSIKTSTVRKLPRGILVQTQTIDSRKRVHGRQYKSYEYDKQGRLRSIASLGAPKIEFQYQKDNKVSQIKEGKHSVVKIRYNPKNGKVQKVTLVGKGSIEMVYGPKGELKSVDGKDRSLSSVIDRKMKMYKNLLRARD